MLSILIRVVKKDKYMEGSRLTNEELEKIIDTARYAPSVHNTQPWRVKNKQSSIEVTIDKSHKLGPGDPTGRQTIISLGIFTEAICLAAETLGFSGLATFNHDKASISFKKKNAANKDVLKLFKKRSTDRSIYQKTAISTTVKESLKKLVKNQSVRIWVIDDEDFIRTAAQLTAKGINLALSNPEFRNELRKYLIRQGSRRKRGISVRSLYIPSMIATLQPEILKFGLYSGKEAHLEEKRWLSASAVVLITSEGDLHNDWFEAGRIYMKVSLEIEKFGLSQATSAAIVEASTFHEDIENILGTDQRLQAILRIGKGSSKRQYSPRVPAAELIT